jgi:hypothetical protein
MESITLEATDLNEKINSCGSSVKDTWLNPNRMLPKILGT